MQNVVCPVCGGNSLVLNGIPRVNSAANDIIRQEYKIVKCTNCNYYFVTPPIDFDDSEWVKLYSNGYFENQSEWLLRKRRQDLTKRFNTIEKFALNPTKSYLDVGCGEGKTLVEAKNRGWSVAGLDIVDHRMEEAKANDILFIEGKLPQSEIKPNSFDIIYMDSVLEHVTTPVEQMQKCYEILKPGGIMYVGVPNEDSFINSVKRFIYTVMRKRDVSTRLKPFHSPFHINGFTKKSFGNIVENTGFSVIQLNNFGRKFSFLSHKLLSKPFLTSLLLMPFEFIGALLKNDVYLEAYLKKENK